MLLGCIAAASALIALGVCFGTGAFSGLQWLWELPVSFLGSFLGLGLLAFLFLVIACATVDTSKPQEHDSKFFRAIGVLYSGAICTLVQARIHKRGLEQLPKSGRFLLVCNHLSDMDPVILLRYFGTREITFLSKWENSSMFVVGKIMHKIKCPLVNRENDREALRTIVQSIDLIKNDELSVAVFPEGYVSKDHKLHPFRSGVLKIALKAQVPIVVCTLTNTQHVFHNAKRLRHTDVDFHLLGVIPFEELKGHTAVDIGNRIHDMMARDLGPQNVLCEE